MGERKYQNVNTKIVATKKEWLEILSANEITDFFGDPNEIFNDLLESKVLIPVIVA